MRRRRHRGGTDKKRQKIEAADITLINSSFTLGREPAEVPTPDDPADPGEGSSDDFVHQTTG